MEEEKAKGTEEREVVEFRQRRALVYLPENTIEATIVASVWDNGNVVKCESTMSMQDIRDAIYSGEHDYICDDDVLTLTDKGREYLDSMKE